MTSAHTATTASQAAKTPGISRKITLLLMATLTIMAGTTISPSLPAIEAAFASVENVQLLSRMVLTLPALFVAFCAPAIGILADRYGRLRLLVGSVLLYGAAGLSGLFVDSLPALLAGRAALGVAIAGIMTLVTALVGDYFAGPERERYLGLQQAFTGLGGVAFVFAGGVMADYHWRLPFAVYGVAFAIVPAAVIFLTEPRRAGPVTTPGTTASTSGAGWQAVIALCLLTFLINLAFYVVPSQLPFQMRSIGIVAPSTAGLALGLHNLVMAATAFGYGRLRASIGILPIFAIGLAMMALGFVLVSLSTGITGVLVAMAVCGAGLGLTVPNLMSAAISVASASTRARVAGTITASMFIGHFSSPIVSQPWVESVGYAMTFRAAGCGLAVLALICASIALVRLRANQA